MKTDWFPEIPVAFAEVHYEVIGMQRRRHQGFCVEERSKNFLKSVLTFWFVLCQDKMNKNLECPKFELASTERSRSVENHDYTFTQSFDSTKNINENWKPTTDACHSDPEASGKLFCFAEPAWRQGRESLNFDKHRFFTSLPLRSEWHLTKIPQQI